MHQKKQLDFDEIVKLVNYPLKKGDTWYLLDKKWYDMCRAYCESGDQSVFPGAIDNSGLFQPLAPVDVTDKWYSSSNSADTEPTTSDVDRLVDALSVDSRPLRSDLSEAEGDFVVVPEKCWNLLKNTFGVTFPNHAIKRRVIETTPGNTIVEIQPVTLKMCLYGGKGATVEKCFSRVTTLDELQQEMRKMYDISPDCETKLWINSQVYTFKANGLSPSKSENNLQTTSPLKPPPTPPPMPSSNFASTSNASTPTVVTRQAANSMSKPIALPDSSTSPTSRSSILSTSTSDSPISSSTSDTKESSASTLAEVGISDSAVVTLEVINNDGTWPSSRPRYGTVSTRSSKAQPGLCGLSNMGNTCFMNSALQCLSNTPPLTNYILTDKFVEDINPSNPLGMRGEIARTYAELIKVMWSGNNTSFMPREFKCAVARFAPQFNGFAQQDCQELMAFLLDGLHEDLNRIRNKPYIEIKNDIERRPDDVVADESWFNYKKRNDSIVVDTFHAMLKSTLVCPGCKLVSVTFDPFCYLSLPLPVKREKQVNMTFIPAPGPISKSELEAMAEFLEPEEIKIIRAHGASISSFHGLIEENGCYSNPANCPKSCKMQVPRSGPASEICDIVARVINEERSSQAEKLDKENLVVAELSTDGRISKVYESNEHYNQIGDDIVVVEKKSDFLLPLYLRERKNADVIAGTIINKPLFLHVSNLEFETVYESVAASLSNLSRKFRDKYGSSFKHNWVKLKVPSEISLDGQDDDQMDCDDEKWAPSEDDSNEDSENRIQNSVAMDTSGESKTNGKTHNMDDVRLPKSAFALCIVNSFGNHVIGVFGPNSNELDYSSKLYIGVTFSSSKPLPPQFEHIRNNKICGIESFTPKVSPKPTLQLKDCITQFTHIERLGADDPWYCPKCKKHQQATKKFDIWSLPEVLIIHLKRFSFSRSWRDKIDTLVEFPVKNLDMSEYVLNPNQKNQKRSVYDLIGVANHFGGLGGGHYTAFAKNHIQNAWYSFDDALVTQTSSNNVVTRSAYVLFYQLNEASKA